VLTNFAVIELDSILFSHDIWPSATCATASDLLVTSLPIQNRINISLHRQWFFNSIKSVIQFWHRQWLTDSAWHHFTMSRSAPVLLECLDLSRHVDETVTTLSSVNVTRNCLQPTYDQTFVWVWQTMQTYYLSMFITDLAGWFKTSVDWWNNFYLKPNYCHSCCSTNTVSAMKAHKL